MKWTLKLLLLNIFVFFLETLFPNLIYFLGFVPALFPYEPWRIVTSLFVHANFTHLFYNMLALFFFGLHFESKYGSKNFLTVYFLSGILGNLAYFILDPSSTIIGVGASGAIYGIIGALAILEPFTIVYINLIPVPLIVVAFFWLLLNFLGIFYPFSNVGYLAHLIGLIVGFIYGLFLKKFS